MLSLLPASIGVGLATSLLFTEMFGLAAGGMVVPGYIALYLKQPASVAATFIAALITFAGVHGLKSVVILYGRRFTAVTIVLGYVVGMTMRQFTRGALAGTTELELIGFIIPGLIAIWMNRQGVLETIAAILTVSAVTRVLLTLVIGEELMS